MAKILNFVRGSYRKQTRGISRSIVRIRGLDVPDTGVLVSSFSFTDKEKNAIIQCFSGVNHVYAFGHDPETSEFSVSYSVFLGNRCMRNGFVDSGYLARIIRSYNRLKLSSGKRTVDVTFGNGLTVIGLVLSAHAELADQEMNIVNVTVSGKAMRIG